MKERGILMSAPMVRALLAGTKTQTRRVVAPSNSTVLGDPAKPFWPHLLFNHAKVQTGSIWASDDLHLSVPYSHPDNAGMAPADCGWYRVRPKWSTGDRLWVRETFALHDDRTPPIIYCRADDETQYETDGRWTSPIFMPRRFSRITLEITGVRVERLNSITQADAIQEGICYDKSVDPIVTFANLWDSINLERGLSWQTNPYVWVLKFRRVQP